MRIEGTTQNNIEQMASAKRINNASDDAAGLAVSEQLSTQINGLNKGADNALSMNDLAKTAEGSLNSIEDNLQSIRFLAVQAGNGSLSADDKKIIQDQINQLKGSISNTAKNTEFNTQKVLDGTFADKNIAVNPQGTGMKMSIQNTSLQTLGIDNFDVTGAFDISEIDKAITKVSDSRSKLGAASNGITYAVDYNNTAQENQQSAESQTSDSDIPSSINKLKNQEILDQYKVFAQKQTLDFKAHSVSLLG